MNRELEETIKSINISYLFALNLDHAIAYRDSKWKLFEPSKFIYSFFTFNMLYDIDWKEIFYRDYIRNDDNRNHSLDKIYRLLEFIHDRLSTDTFNKTYSKYDNELRIMRNSKSIVPDYNINYINRSSFLQHHNSYLRNYRSALLKIQSREFDIIDHYNLVIFCYQIRNNIFHGHKKASEMIQSGQRIRLLDYSNIIIATIEMFFDILKDDYGYRLATDDEFTENTQIDYLN